MAKERFHDIYYEQGNSTKINARVLGHTHVTVLEKDGKIIIALGDGGGFWPSEMKEHMDNPLVKLLRDFIYASRKDTYKDLKAGIKEFDYEL